VTPYPEHATITATAHNKFIHHCLAGGRALWRIPMLSKCTAAQQQQQQQQSAMTIVMLLK